MSWLVPLVTYACFATMTLWLHMRCFVVVAAGYCEIKFRWGRIGKARYAALRAGSHFVLPFIQRRLPGSAGEPGVVFPVTADTAQCVKTGRMAARTHGGRCYLLVDAEFEYYVDDVDAWMRYAHLPRETPAAAARANAEHILVTAIAQVRETREDCIVSSVEDALGMVCKEINRDSALKMTVRCVRRAWMLTDLLGKGRATE